MADSPLYGEKRPSVQGFRRSSSQFAAIPTRSLSIHEKAGLDRSDASAEVLYSHPTVRIYLFAPPKESIKSSSTAEIPRDTDYPVDTIETLPWRSRTEKLTAVGPLVIEKVRGSTYFLKCQDLTHAILRNSQCWCVDNVSKFVMRIGPFRYYRIELPFEGTEHKKKVEEFKVVLAKVLRYEYTPCPFLRAFQVELPDDAITPRRKGQWKRRESLTPITPDSEDQFFRKPKTSRTFSLRGPPPTAFPPRFSQSSPERPRTATEPSVTLQSPWRDNRSKSPAEYISSEEDTGSDRHDMDSDSHEETQRSAQGSETGRSSAEPNVGDNQEPRTHSTGPETLPESKSKLTSKQTVGSVVERIESAELKRRTSVTAVPRSRSVRRQHRISANEVEEDDVDNAVNGVSRTVNIESSTTNQQRTENTVQPKIPETPLALPDESHEQAGSDTNAEPPEDRGLENEDTLDTGSLNTFNEHRTPENQAEAELKIKTEAFPNDLNIQSDQDSRFVGETQASDLEATDQTDEITHAEMTDGTESVPSSPLFTFLQADMVEVSGDELPPSMLQNGNFDEDDFLNDAAFGPKRIEAETHYTQQHHDMHISNINDKDKATQKQDENQADDDTMSTTSADSFHTTDSINKDEGDESVDVDAFSFIQRPSKHKRDISELTVTASTAGSFVQNVEEIALQQIDSASGEGSNHAEISNARTAREDNPSSELRQRLRHRRSLSPMPPASTIVRSVSNEQGTEMSRAILQKAATLAVVKPVEMIVMIFHILNRIAHGATVNDLMSGELFRRPGIRRTASGTFDSNVIQRANPQNSEDEDDYGVPLAGRRRSSVISEAGWPTSRVDKMDDDAASSGSLD